MYKNIAMKIRIIKPTPATYFISCETLDYSLLPQNVLSVIRLVGRPVGGSYAGLQMSSPTFVELHVPSLVRRIKKLEGER